MQTSLLPVSVVNEVDRCERRCVWGSNDEKKKVHLVNWKTVCRIKQDGGWV